MQITIPQAAEKLGISRQRLHLMVKAKRIVAKRVGRTWVIESAEVVRFSRVSRKTGRPRIKAALKNGKKTK